MTSIVSIFLLTGLVSGFIAGLLGVGGGIIIVPVTYFILLNLGYSSEIVMHVAVASSLGVICFTSISSIRSHVKLKNTNLIIVKKWAIGIIIGSIAGSIAASSISGQSLVILFVILAFLISLNMLFQQNPIIVSKDIPSSNIINFLISSSIGFLIAFPGTLTFMYTGSNINELPIYSLGYVNIIIVFFISLTSIFTAGIGAKVSSNIDKLVLRKIFAIFLLLTCASLIIEHFII